MPRLSVDLDLTYLPIADRISSLREIDAAMRRIADAIGRGIPGGRVNTGVVAAENCLNRLIVSAGGVQIKIEVTPVMRGCVNEPAVKPVSARVEDEFGYAEIQVVSFPDLYAGKIVAALDRQHPRDLFDVRDLLANEGIGEGLRKVSSSSTSSATTCLDGGGTGTCAPRHRVGVRQGLRRHDRSIGDARRTPERTRGVDRRHHGRDARESPTLSDVCQTRRAELGAARACPARKRYLPFGGDSRTWPSWKADKRATLLGRLGEVLGIRA